VRSIFHHPDPAMPEFSPGEHAGRTALLARFTTRHQAGALRYLAGCASAVLDAILEATDPRDRNDQDQRYEWVRATCGELAGSSPDQSGTGRIIRYWFNAIIYDGKVMVVDGQRGRIENWPPSVNGLGFDENGTRWSDAIFSTCRPTCDRPTAACPADS